MILFLSNLLCSTWSFSFAPIKAKSIAPKVFRVCLLLDALATMNGLKLWRRLFLWCYLLVLNHALGYYVTPTCYYITFSLDKTLSTFLLIDFLDILNLLLLNTWELILISITKSNFNQNDRSSFFESISVNNIWIFYMVCWFD